MAAGAPPKLAARGVCVAYHNRRTGTRTVALENIHLEIREGEFVCIVGPSGCGKTTFLNAIDGLVELTAGSIELDGKPIAGPGPDRAVVFQSPSLLPWRTVLGNVMYGLQLQRHPPAVCRERAMEYVRLVGLGGFEHHYPGELSGGMQQRVNLARALACDPQLLLLDEPFASLDAQTREFMQFELLKIWQQARKTALFITHQINEAIYLADRVLVFGARPGRVKEEIPIELPRPRPLGLKRSPEFLAYEDRIWALIEEEAKKQGLVRVVAEPPAEAC